jgi:hypothetical protein
LPAGSCGAEPPFPRKHWKVVRGLKGGIRAERISLSPDAWEVLGKPAAITAIAFGIDLVVIADGASPLEIRPSGSVRFWIRDPVIRALLIPGKYAVMPSRHHGLRGVVFKGALAAPRDHVMGAKR